MVSCFDKKQFIDSLNSLPRLASSKQINQRVIVAILRQLNSEKSLFITSLYRMHGFYFKGLQKINKKKVIDLWRCYWQV